MASYLNNNSGKALLMVMISSVVTAAIALTATKFNSFDAKRTGKYINSKKAFYIAEAGLQKALNLLHHDSEGIYPGDIGEEGFTKALNSFIQNRNEILVNYNFGGGVYTVSIADNNDGDGDDLTDQDNVIYINSLGGFIDSCVEVEALVLNDFKKQALTILSWKEKKIGVRNCGLEENFSLKEDRNNNEIGDQEQNEIVDPEQERLDSLFSKADQEAIKKLENGQGECSLIDMTNPITGKTDQCCFATDNGGGSGYPYGSNMVFYCGETVNGWNGSNFERLIEAIKKEPSKWTWQDIRTFDTAPFLVKLAAKYVIDGGKLKRHDQSRIYEAIKLNDTSGHSRNGNLYDPYKYEPDRLKRTGIFSSYNKKLVADETTTPNCIGATSTNKYEHLGKGTSCISSLSAHQINYAYKSSNGIAPIKQVEALNKFNKEILGTKYASWKNNKNIKSKTSFMYDHLVDANYTNNNRYTGEKIN